MMIANRLYLFYMKKCKPLETEMSIDVHGNECTNTTFKKTLESWRKNEVA